MKDNKPLHSVLLDNPEKNKPVPGVVERNIDTSKNKIDQNLTELANTRSFQCQYAHTYTIRLWTMKKILTEKINKEWDMSQYQLKNISDLSEASENNPNDRKSDGKKGKSNEKNAQNIVFHEGVSVVIIGTIFKQQPLKPSILQELGEDINAKIVEAKDKYISEEDCVVIEDESGRVKLEPLEESNLSIHELVNGIVCAFRGKPTIQGKFQVSDVIWPTPAISAWPDLTLNNRSEMIFISGLQIGRMIENRLSLDLLLEYLEGFGGSPEEQENDMIQKTRVFFVGNTFWSEQKKELTRITDTAQEIDSFLERLATTMEVFILPDLEDPCPPMMPQPAFHRAIFPKSSKIPTFHSLTNPAKLTVDISTSGKEQNLSLILCGGCNVADALKYSNIESPLEMAKNLLKWSHICPTAPDTLPMLPGNFDDPFIIKDTLPNLFVVGNQPKFDVAHWNSTAVICLPKFSEHSSIVLFDKNLEVRLFKFENFL